jgi:hypothetical protein
MIGHDHEFFYKYVSASTAKAILRTDQVRWSAPRLFNDPFDFQFDLNIPYSEDEYCEAMLRKMLTIYREGRAGPIRVDSPYIGMFNVMFDNFSKIGVEFSDSEFAHEFGPAIRECYSTMVAALPAMQKDIRGVFEKFCVFCVSEKADNLLMWAHYANSHSGAVIKFKCLPEKDTVLCAAIPIQYEHNMPTLAGVDDYVGQTLGVAPIDYNGYANTLVATKGSEWSYEKEWRVVSEFENREDFEQGHTDFPIFREEIVEITLGCRMETPDRDELISLVADKYCHAVVRQAHANEMNFSLYYEEIKPPE